MLNIKNAGSKGGGLVAQAFHATLRQPVTEYTQLVSFRWRYCQVYKNEVIYGDVDRMALPTASSFKSIPITKLAMVHESSAAFSLFLAAFAGRIKGR